MKRFISLTLSIVMFFALVVVAQADTVSNSPHNLSASGTDFFYASTETQICIFCHTPHGGNNTGPLWNRDSLVGTFTMYTSTTASSIVTDLFATPVVSPESMLCLTCHDGSVSLYEMMNWSSAGKPTGLNTGSIVRPIRPSQLCSICAADLALLMSA